MKDHFKYEIITEIIKKIEIDYNKVYCKSIWVKNNGIA